MKSLACKGDFMSGVRKSKTFYREIVHEENNHPVMCGNVSIRHRIFYVSGLDFLSRSMASSMARLIKAVALSPIASA